MIILLVGTLSILTQISDAYVLLQVRRQDDNHSNIDALIHKTVPSDKFEDIVQKIARKRFPDKNKNSAEKMQQLTDIDNGGEQNTKKQNGEKEDGEPISLSVGGENNQVDLATLIEMGIEHMAKNGQPNLRSTDTDKEYKPKTIKFRSGESSLLYEINTKTVVSAMNNILSSKMVQDYVDSLARKAAFVYRSIKSP